MGYFAEVLVHTKGRYARQPFVLADWQSDDIIRPLFGCVIWDPELEAYVRIYVVVWIEVARKNGKSELLAGIALYLLMADGEESAEIYGCAKDVKQARKVWDVAHRMVILSPVLNKLLQNGDIRINLQEKRIVYEPTGSYYEIITRDALGELGHNPHGIIFDEVLAQPDGDLWEAMETAMGAREQPMLAAATTAGNDPSSFAAKEHKVSERVVEDPKRDPRRLVYMRNMPKKADWRDIENYRYSNPAMGDFLRQRVIEDEIQKAIEDPTKENSVRQFRGNQWVQQRMRWLVLHLWDACGAEPHQLFLEDELKGAECYGGFDLSTTKDITSWALVFPWRIEFEDEVINAVRVKWRYWLPEQRLTDLDKRTGDQGSVWVRQGLLYLTPGNVIDYDEIERQIGRDAETYAITEIGYDPWQAHATVQHLADGGLAMAKVPQQMPVLTDPTKQLERLVTKGLFHHNNDPVARWMADNVVLKKSRDGEMQKPDKENSGDSIDGIAAALNALERHIANNESGYLYMREEPEEEAEQEG